MPWGFTLNVKAFRKMTSPFTLNHQGIFRKAFTLDVKTYYPQSTKSFLSLASQATAGKKGKPGRAAVMETDRGSCADP
ncbi:hypothetical protein C0033_13930 [Clostridium sp. chh4-2]|nr:hypothetical protein C0033_13930 [Clostridium sp. chh4-2]